MLVLGLVILAFTVVHLIQFWAKMRLKGDSRRSRRASSQLPAHFSSGRLSPLCGLRLSTSSASLPSGCTSTTVSGRCSSLSAGITRCGLPASKRWLAGGGSIVVLLFIARAIVFTVKAHENYYKTNETLREQYKEMLAPMFEKDFGHAAQAITSAPFDQMKQMVKGTLTQMEQPEAQSYFANDPQFPARLETIRRAPNSSTISMWMFPPRELAPAENPQPAN